jgi:hypothetical protein
MVAIGTKTVRRGIVSVTIVDVGEKQPHAAPHPSEPLAFQMWTNSIDFKPQSMKEYFQREHQQWQVLSATLFLFLYGSRTR